MDQNLSFQRRRCFRRAFDCNVHADGSLFVADHRVYKIIAGRALSTLEMENLETQAWVDIWTCAARRGDFPFGA